MFVHFYESSCVFCLCDIAFHSLSIRRSRLQWFRLVEHKNNSYWFEQCTLMETEGTRQRGPPRKTRWDCVKVDMESFGLSHDDAEDRDQWRLKIGGTG